MLKIKSFTFFSINLNVIRLKIMLFLKLIILNEIYLHFLQK